MSGRDLYTRLRRKVAAHGTEVQIPLMNAKSKEERSLELLGELQLRLANAINSWNGTPITGSARYLAHSAVHVNKLVGGYRELRTQGNGYASKMLIRPMIEMTLAAKAVFDKPGFLFRKIYSEYLEDRKLLERQVTLIKAICTDPLEREDLLSRCRQHLADCENAFAAYESLYSSNLPNENLSRTAVSAYEAAHVAKLPEFYVTYSTYCQYIHAALRAVTGELDVETDPNDTPIVVAAIMVLLETLHQAGMLGLPYIQVLRSRIEALAS